MILWDVISIAVFAVYNKPIITEQVNYMQAHNLEDT